VSTMRVSWLYDLDLCPENPRVPSSILGPATTDFKGLAEIGCPFFCFRQRYVQHFANPVAYLTAQYILPWRSAERFMGAGSLIFLIIFISSYNNS
jgi:hypothetical protein